MRIGQGIDIHAFAEGRPLVLGGVTVPHDRGLAGHSDADVVLHAIIDAMLGAAALGDIGGMFPSTDPRWSEANSLDLLRTAHAHVGAAGYRVVNLDATIVAEQPRLAPYVETMRVAIASALGAKVGDISIKVTSADGLGLTGRGEGIAALAAVLLDSMT